MFAGHLRAAWLLIAALGASSAQAAPNDYFAIEVVDDSTGRGVPLVALITVNGVSSWTDSQGLPPFSNRL